MVQLIRIAAVLAALLVPAGAFALSEPDYTDPRKVVEAAYEPYFEGDDFNWSDYDKSALYSREMNELFNRDAADSEAAGEIGRLDFDPLINAQDYQLSNLVIGDAKITGKSATVPVTFDNMGTPMVIEIDLVEEDYGWSIDDVRSIDGEVQYSLREILEAPYP